MRPSGASTATAVRKIVTARGTPARGERAASRSAGRASTMLPPGVMPAFPAPGLLRRQGLLPVVQEVEALLLVEIGDDLRADRDRLHVVAELLVQLRGGVLGVDVVADRE